MRERFIAGIDVGSSHIRLAVGQVLHGADKRENLNMIGAVEVASQGISKGMVNALEDVVSAVSSCLEMAERQIGLPVTEAYIGINGCYTSIQPSKGVIGVSRADGEIREEDVHRVLESARSVTNPVNYEVLHVIPRGFTVDNQGGVKDPIGMQGIRLEVDAHIIQGLSTPVRNLTKAVSRTGLDITALVFAPLATALAVSTPRQRDVGTVVVNIGSTVTSVVVYEEGELLHAAILPVGADHITNDIAVGLRTSLDVAESLKRSHASAWAEQVGGYEECDLRDMGAEQSEPVSVRFVSEVAQARVEEIFEKVEQELRRIDRSGLLPAGVLLTGGGVKLRGVPEVAKQVLRLPVAIASAQRMPTPLIEIGQDPAFATAVGLVLWGYESERQGAGQDWSGAGKGDGFMKKIGSPLKKIFKSFIP
jgi:cell division protein FtsA